ncbi:MAG: RMD1 family protein [Patescibacteria group bacterium]
MIKYQVTAHYVNTSLKLAKIEQNNHQHDLLLKERNLLFYRLNDHKFVAVFSFGVVAIFGSDSPDETKGLIHNFSDSHHENEPPEETKRHLDEIEPEVYDVRIEPENVEAVLFDYIRLKDLSSEKIMLIFQLIAQSVAIDFLEGELDRAIQRFERVHRGLEQKGKLVMGTHEVMRIIGRSGNILNFIIDKLSLLDKPDITWEEEAAERLHASLRKALELEDRFSALKFKIEFVQDSSRLVLEVLENRKAAWLEWIVIVLIAMEFLFFIYAEFV